MWACQLSESRRWKRSKASNMTLSWGKETQRMLTYVKPGQNIIQYCLLQKLLIAKNKEKHIKEEQVQVVKLIKPAM